MGSKDSLRNRSTATRLDDMRLCVPVNTRQNFQATPSRLALVAAVIVGLRFASLSASESSFFDTLRDEGKIEDTV